jgi:hypothetical protein
MDAVSIPLSIPDTCTLPIGYGSEDWIAFVSLYVFRCIEFVNDVRCGHWVPNTWLQLIVDGDGSWFAPRPRVFSDSRSSL